MPPKGPGRDYRKAPPTGTWRIADGAAAVVCATDTVHSSPECIVIGPGVTESRAIRGREVFPRISRNVGIDQAQGSRTQPFPSAATPNGHWAWPYGVSGTNSQEWGGHSGWSGESERGHSYPVTTGSTTQPITNGHGAWPYGVSGTSSQACGRQAGWSGESEREHSYPVTTVNSHRRVEGRPASLGSQRENTVIQLLLLTLTGVGRAFGLVCGVRERTQLSSYYCKLSQAWGGQPGWSVESEREHSVGRAAGLVWGDRERTQLSSYYCKLSQAWGGQPGWSVESEIEHSYPVTAVNSHRRGEGSRAGVGRAGRLVWGDRERTQLSSYCCKLSQAWGGQADWSGETEREHSVGRAAGLVWGDRERTQLSSYYCKLSQVWEGGRAGLRSQRENTVIQLLL
ncbi:hypothetical protein Bbelb_077560 [Branchiostoma belcheri]|nr:hypothetical protein Bbelb_077560 [Branchiostoma belcheri]